MYLGIDLGTSGVKSILIDDEQRLIGEHTSRPLDVSRPHRGWSEQHPDCWWEAVCESLDGLAGNYPKEMAATRGIGLSGQMYGATVLDAADNPLRPAILWNDTRSAKQCADIEASEADARTIAGRRATPGVTASKLAWLRENEPELFDQIRTVLLPKDFIRLRLSGDKASEMSDSSGTYWMDVKARTWSDRLLAASGMDRSQMPALYEGTAATGRLRRQFAERWGMANNPVLAGGGGDNACGACGTGVIGNGQGTVSLGTSGVLFVSTDTANPSADYAIETLCHAVPGVWHQMSVILSATSCVNWLAARLKRPAFELVTQLGDALSRPSPVLFLPFLDGSWSPRDDQEIRGALIGLTHGSDDDVLVKAVLQGVAYAMRECADAFRSTGTTIDSLLAIGGGSRSDLWLKMLATCLDVELNVPISSELGAAFGAARLGMIAANDASPNTVLTQPKIARTIAPDRVLVPQYQDSYHEWLAVMPAVQKASAALGRAA